jgi:hypothetical protein
MSFRDHFDKSGRESRLYSMRGKWTNVIPVLKNEEKDMFWKPHIDLLPSNP